LIKLQDSPRINEGCLINKAQRYVPFAQLVQALLHCPGYQADGCLIHPLPPLPVLRANGARILRPLLQQVQSFYLEWFVHTRKYRQQGWKLIHLSPNLQNLVTFRLPVSYCLVCQWVHGKSKTKQAGETFRNFEDWEKDELISER